jgi:uncharacterized membrane protein
MRSASDAPRQGSRTYALLFGFVLLALALRWPLLSRSVWFDEACMSHQRTGTWEQLLATLYVDIHPPLYVAFMHFWNATFGDSALSMRTPPLVCGLLSILAVFWAGRRFVGDRAALIAAGLLACSPAHLWYSAEARLYTPMALSALLAVGCWHRLLRGEGGVKLWLAHGLNLLVMITLHYYLAVYVLLLAALAPLVLRGWTPAVKKLWLAHGGALVLLAGFVGMKMAFGHFEKSQDYMRDLTVAELLPLFAGWMWTGNVFQALAPEQAALADALRIGAAVLWIALALLGGCAILRARGERPDGPWLAVLALAIPAFLFCVPWIGLHKNYIERSTIAALPFVLLWIGAGLDAAGRRFGVLLGVLVAVVLAVSLGTIYRYQHERWTVYKPNPDWASAAAYLGGEIDSGVAGRPIFTSKPNPRSLCYYDGRIQDVKNLEPAAELGAIGGKVRKRFGAWLGDFAERTFTEFERQKAELLANAKLFVYRAGEGTVASLDPRAKIGDGVFYLLRNHWHPPGDTTVESLVASPEIEILETRAFAGVSVWKARLRR